LHRNRGERSGHHAHGKPACDLEFCVHDGICLSTADGPK
jgi:hypothetical protein